MKRQIKVQKIVSDKTKIVNDQIESNGTEQMEESESKVPMFMADVEQCSKSNKQVRASADYWHFFVYNATSRLNAMPFVIVRTLSSSSSF